MPNLKHYSANMSFAALKLSTLTLLLLHDSIIVLCVYEFMFIPDKKWPHKLVQYGNTILTLAPILGSQ